MKFTFAQALLSGKRSAGMTLVEMMVSLAVGSMVLTAANGREHYPIAPSYFRVYAGRRIRNSVSQRRYR